MDIQREREALIAEIERFKEEAMKSYVVSCWAESYTNTDPFGYVILENENNKVWWLKTQAYQLWEMWQAAKTQAVPEWKDYELEKPIDGQKCLVIFESKDCEDAQRWMCIDEFNEGMFDFIANWEDQCASVALPAGSIISKVRAVCWATTNLSNAPLSFDQFYEAQEPTND